MSRRGNEGRHDCNLCAKHTKGQDVALFYRLDIERGQQHVVLRAHASHFDPGKTSEREIMRNLAAISQKMDRTETLPVSMGPPHNA